MGECRDAMSQWGHTVGQCGHAVGQDKAAMGQCVLWVSVCCGSVQVPVTRHLLASPAGTAWVRKGERGISSPPYLTVLV